MQIEKAGGHSSGDGKGVSGLDIKVEQHDQVRSNCPLQLTRAISTGLAASLHTPQTGCESV